MIKVSSTCSCVKDTGGIRLEDSLVSFDGDSERLLLDGSLHLRDIASSDEAFGVDLDTGS